MPVPNYPRPPFKQQQQSFPGRTEKMDPRPDHGEDSYVGHGQLKGKRALITGGDSGIGAAVALAYAREGADVAIAFLPDEQEDAARIGALIEKAGVKALLVGCDISDPSQAAALIDKVNSTLGGLDILVNNAGYQKYFESFDDITLDEWRKTFDTNVHAVFNLVRLSVPLMTDGGAIINTASVQSKKPTPNILPYCSDQGRTGQPHHWPGWCVGREEHPRQCRATGPDLDTIYSLWHGRRIGGKLRCADADGAARSAGRAGIGLRHAGG